MGTIKVRATQRGFNGVSLQEIGDVFEISDARNEAGEIIALSNKWMERVPQDDGQPATL